MRRFPFPAVRVPTIPFKQVRCSEKEYDEPSGHMEPQPRDTHFSQGTWDVVRRRDFSNQVTSEAKHCYRIEALIFYTRRKK